MKKGMPLEGLRWSRDSGSALYDTPQTAVLGRAGGHGHRRRLPKVMAQQTNLIRYPQQPNWRGSATR